MFLRISYVRFRSRRLYVHFRIIARISRCTPRNIFYESFLMLQTFSYAFLNARVRVRASYSRYASPADDEQCKARRHCLHRFTAHTRPLTRQHQIFPWRELSNCRTMEGSSRPPLPPSGDRLRAEKFDPRFEQNVQARAALFHAALKADVFSKGVTKGFEAAAKELEEQLKARGISYNGVPKHNGLRGKLVRYVEIYRHCALLLPFYMSTCLILRFPDCPLSSAVRWSLTGRLLICHAI